MRNRLEMGFLRYGGASEKTKYDLTKAIETKLALYKESGNTENLVDIGNYAMLEFKFGTHPKKHFYAGDDVGHAELKK